MQKELSFKCPKCKMQSSEYKNKSELMEARKKHKELCLKLQEITRDYEAYLDKAR